MIFVILSIYLVVLSIRLRVPVTVGICTAIAAVFAAFGSYTEAVLLLALLFFTAPLELALFRYVKSVSIRSMVFALTTLGWLIVIPSYASNL